MPRIRTIKPETAESQSLGRVSRDARLLFILSWTLADDEGRLRAAPAMLAGRLFPFDKDAGDLIVGWLDELEREALLHRYQDGGNDYMVITGWSKHQKIDHPTKSRLPDPPSEILAKPRETSREPARLSHATATDPEPIINDPVSHLDGQKPESVRHTHGGAKEKNQNIDNQSKSLDLANPREASRETAKISESLAPDLGPRTEDQERKNIGRAASPQRPVRVKADLEGFERFWSVWPNKVKKLAAQKAWPKALAAAGSIEVILAGVERYRLMKPDWQSWPHPASWLSGQQWTDEGLTDGQAPLSEAERGKLLAERARAENCPICRGKLMVKLRYGAPHRQAGQPVSTRCPHDAEKLRDFCARGHYEWLDDPNRAAPPPKTTHQPSILMPLSGGFEKTSESLASSREDARDSASGTATPPTLDIPPFLRRTA